MFLSPSQHREGRPAPVDGPDVIGTWGAAKGDGAPPPSAGVGVGLLAVMAAPAALTSVDESA